MGGSNWSISYLEKLQASLDQYQKTSKNSSYPDEFFVLLRIYIYNYNICHQCRFVLGFGRR